MFKREVKSDLISRELFQNKLPRGFLCFRFATGLSYLNKPGCTRKTRSSRSRRNVLLNNIDVRRWGSFHRNKCFAKFANLWNNCQTKLCLRYKIDEEQNRLDYLIVRYSFGQTERNGKLLGCINTAPPAPKTNKCICVKKIKIVTPLIGCQKFNETNAR